MYVDEKMPESEHIHEQPLLKGREDLSGQMMKISSNEGFQSNPNVSKELLKDSYHLSHGGSETQGTRAS